MAARAPLGGRHGRPVPVAWMLQLALITALVMTMLGPIMTFSGSAEGGGNSIRQIFYFGAAFLAFLGVCGYDAPRRLLSMPWPVVIALAYCLFTLFWSAVPGTGGRRLILTVLSSWTIFTTCAFLPFNRSVATIRLVLFAAVIANILVALLLPQIGVHQAADVLDKNLIGDWCGFMSQKNLTGAATGIAILALVFGGGRLPLALRAIGVAIAFVLLWKTGSRTSLAMTLAAIGIGGVYLFYSARYRAAVIIALLVSLVLVSSLTNVFRLDKSPVLSDRKTLSGRVDIWEAVLRYLDSHHWIGAGYGSFWDVGPTSPIFRYGKGWVTELAQAHNGYLDLLATIGVPGLAIVLFAYFGYPLFKLLGNRYAQGMRGALVIAIMAFALGHNATESTLMDRDNIVQIFLTVGLALLFGMPRPAPHNVFSILRDHGDGDEEMFLLTPPLLEERESDTPNTISFSRRR